MNKDYMKNGINRLIERKVAKKDDFADVNIHENDFKVFEDKYKIKIPESLRIYLSSKSFDFNMIMAPIPDDSEYGEALLDEDCECSLIWLDILSVPKDKPLRDLYNRMEGFREMVEECIDDVALADIQNMIPIGDYMAGAGVMVMDLSKKEQDVKLADENTWNIRWFDHEEFEWNSEYRNAEGKIEGNPAFPNLETMIDFYFNGKYDKKYEENESIDYEKLINRA